MLKTYSYEEALQSSIEYFGNELSARAFVDKYALKDENNNLLEANPNDMHQRMAREIARVEKNKFEKPLSYEEIYKWLEGFSKIIPQGSIMASLGNNRPVSLSNCFVIDSPEDSYGSILNSDQELIQISKRRGGVGVDISNLRPKNVLVNNAARTSTGTVSWMERFSNSIREVSQNGRRGALLETISVHHPDILDFCTVKQNLTKVTGANISIRLSDEFLTALENNTWYELRWPETNPKIQKKILALQVWDTIIHSNHASAEPGLLFWQRIIDECPADCYEDFKSKTCNPCVPSSSYILTENGIKQFKNVNINDYIWTKEGFRKVINKKSSGVKKVYEYVTTAGRIQCTDNHKLVIDKKGNKVEAKDANTIEIITGPTPKNVILNPEIIMDGLVLGDGSVHKASNNLVGLYIGINDQDYFSSEIAFLIKKHRPGIKNGFYTIKTNINSSELPCTYNRNIPDRYKYSDSSTVCSLLRGLFSANGSVCDNRISLKSSSLDIIKDVQVMLSSIGIASYYTTSKSNSIKFSNGEYLCKQSYDLNITADREKFVQYIGFIQQYKNEKIKIVKSDKPKKTVYDIIETNFITEEEVFDITVDNLSHTYWSGGCNISNCGEINLAAYDACRLLAINLFHIVDNPFQETANINYDSLYNTAYIAQRIMDDIVDLELEAIQRIISKIKSDPEVDSIKTVELNLWNKIYKACNNGRRTGTGITALGDTLAAANIKYDSDKGITTTEKIYRTIKHACYRSSVDMAKELGAFPVFDYEKEKNNPFLNRIKNEDAVLYEDMIKYGRRNIALLTTAPTGTVSMMASMNAGKKRVHGTTSGIEPLFMTSYTRRKKGNPGDNDFRTDFVDQSGDNWMEFEVYHPGLELWMDVTGTQEIEKSPYITADKINWKNRVRLQAAAQLNICHCISSTINVPSEITQEEIGEIYLEAWKAGLKGITVYRDGCRTGVLVNKTEEKNKVIHNNAPKRPIELPCDVHHITVKGQPYFVLVGKFGDSPYEIFAGKNGVIDKKVKNGTIIKQKRGRYKAIFDDDSELSPIGAFTTDEEDVVTRLISTSLRHGANVEFVLSQLSKAKGDLQSFAKCLARALKKYLNEGQETTDKCPECGTKLIFEEGCKKCKSCSFSGCN